ncbi:MAG: 3-oxoacyl-[acyl-carrier-protein] reductase [Myxococcota bacterium]
METLSGKVAFVTGASRGIGRAVALALAQREARVVLCCATRQQQAQEIASRIQQEGGQACVKVFDIACKDQVDRVVGEVTKQWGGVDVLINNAGLAIDGLCVRFTQQDWQRVIQVNLAGAFFCMQACAVGMMKKRWGRIITISSVVGQAGNAGQVAYASAKAGLLGMSKSLALELASRSITVNVVSPGFIETDMTTQLAQRTKESILSQIPLGRMGTAQEVAEAVAFLASHEAAYITGQTLSVNGGLYRS